MKPLFLLLGLVMLNTAVTSAYAQGTAFTYEGRLNENGTTASGNYDLQFKLYDAQTNGNLVAGPITKDPTVVSNGLFTVTLNFGAGAFPGTARWLEIGSRPSGNSGAYTTVIPRRPVDTSPYAITAASVTGSINGALITGGTITPTQLAPGVAAANLNATGQSAVSSGGAVVSFSPNDPDLANAGYVRIATELTTSEEWLERVPAGRSYHTAVWTGSEMIIWGGVGGGNTPNTGGRYNPAANSWIPLSTSGAPMGRTQHTAVWTGTEMIVWGGAAYLNDGGRYNPIANTWVPTSLTNAPQGRSQHTAVWTGTEMIIYGGYGDGGFEPVALNDGGRYNPSSDSWTALPSGPGGRYLHTAVWTGTQMIVWGGTSYSNGFYGYASLGGRYTPSTNTWTYVDAMTAPPLRSMHTAVWTGTEMIIWGGWDSGVFDDGSRYNPSANSWTAMTSNGVPAARYRHSAVWTGSEMIVWGGGDSSGSLAGGGRYNPATDTWNTVSAAGAPSARIDLTAVWTSSEMIVWGGSKSFTTYDNGGRYNPATDSWAFVGGPSGRYLHTAVWTGTEMIVWGGLLDINGTFANDGWRYNLTTNSWTATSLTGVPAARELHSAVWTGTEMIIWGGANGSGPLNSGGRYNPATNSWAAVSLTAVPTARVEHSTVWTGTEMIVWGGYDSNSTDLNTGGRYSPSNNTWSVVNTSGAPTARHRHTAVWTGTEMILWGGYSFVLNSPLNTGGRYNPTANTWSTVTTSGAPGARALHSAVWTGSEMIVWGGSTNAGYLNDGGKYNPTGNSWSSVTTSNAPTARDRHTAIWTGEEMIVWGGTNNSSSFNTGGRYNPSINIWTALTTTGAPKARNYHSAVWTGTQMIIWGGINGNNYLSDGFSYFPSRALHLYQRP